MVGAVAEAGDFPLGIHTRTFRECVKRSRRAETGGHHSGLNVARANRPHHVVAAARTDENIPGKSPSFGKFGPEDAGRL